MLQKKIKKKGELLLSLVEKYINDKYFIYLSKEKDGLFEIPTDMTIEERIMLYRIGRNLKKRSIIVEIGSFLGASSSFLAIAAKETNSHVFCVDTWQNDAMSEGKRDTYAEFLKNISELSGWITPIRGYSEHVSKEFRDRIDLLFIDGDHSYDSVKQDLDNWLPKLNINSWLIMHDSGWAEGVKQVINEIVIPLHCQKPKILQNLYSVRINYFNFPQTKNEDNASFVPKD
jgi:predicted O-methyltransferase YrrM